MAEKSKYRKILNYRKPSLWILALLLFLMLAGLLLKSPLLRLAINARVKNFNAAWHADLVIRKVTFRGISTACLEGITLKPADGDSLLRIDTLQITISPWKLVTGRLVVDELELRNIRLTMMRQDSVTNYMFLLGKAKYRPEATLPEKSDSVAAPGDYGIMADRLGRFVFDRIPHSLKVSGLDVTTHADGHRVHFHLDKFDIQDHFFHAGMQVEEDSASALWTLTGKLDNHKRLAAFRIYSKGPLPVSVPYIDFRWQAKVKFDTIAFSLAEETSDDGRTMIRGFAAIRGLTVNHAMIASQPVTFDKLAADYTIIIGNDYIELDSSTTVTFNRIDLHPYVRYRPSPSKQITLRIHKPEFPAQDLFESLPPALFTTLQGLKTKGNLSWYLNFFVDLAQPDSLQFATDLVRHQFSVTSYGSSDLTRINSPFAYTAYEHDTPVRTFMVGPENPDFRPLERISPYLRAAVMTAEDGGFYLHRGFLADAFRESIITNIKEGRFARGGSTISMQLVKNVYLNRTKNVARKLEEALIVWLIENQGLCTKDRMFEVYLNIIEWGPMVYGAGEASHFYFNKEPSRLTLAEAIYLASIIPRPKWFRYSFDQNGHLNVSNAGFYRLVAGKMLNKGWITLRDAEKLVPDVDLKGPARLLLQKADTVKSDSSGMLTW